MDPQAVLEFLKGLVMLVWSYDGVKVIVSHIVINLVVALAAAQKVGDLNLGRIGEFLFKKLLPYVAVYAVIKAFGEATGLTALGPVVWTVIEASLTGDLGENLDKLGLPLPNFVRRLVVKV